ncbi:MAG: molybdate ABC transporter substrate-binding protein [Verrucomicrobiales bacterium]|jgi:molybdate transport system substrate-binding protein
MNSAKPLFFAALLVIIALSGLLLFKGSDRAQSSNEELELHCAAGLRIPITEIVERYQEEYGITIRTHFAGSGELASQLEVAGGDLYLPADISYIETTQSKGLVKEAIPAAYLTAGIAVAKGNPKSIRSLADLGREDVRVSLANPSAAIGKFTKKVLSGINQWEAIEANATVFKFTVNDIAQDVSTGSADATIVWDAVAGMFDNLEFVHVPEFDQRRKTATIGVLTESKHPTMALRFARYLTASDRGLENFQKHGFQVVEGDPWELHPELTFFSGSMLRPAIEQQLRLFEEREGVRIIPEYEGCGILVSMMEAGAEPDAYFSCDLQFLDRVQDRFEKGTIVTKNDMILLVAKGNPKKIGTLNDLLRDGLKVGLAHPQKSALGKLTLDLLEKRGLYEKLNATGNLSVLASKGDELANQMQIGALDGAIIYRSNALSSEQILEQCEMIDIANDAQAVQPFAVARKSSHKQLARRLEKFLTGAAGKEQFLKYGFHWELTP